ncbi:Small G protein signaling modulator 3 [Polyplax serrata]|uniref:Small G protein signaling modulator 3 n=1 Tax=Polyplax serrata TaxID=468196 RepID=A0AAN8S7T4_POLSC
MEIAKSLFGDRTHDGYVGRSDHNKRLETAVSDCEGNGDNLDEMENSYLDEEYDTQITPGGPFSALTKSMLSKEIYANLRLQKQSPNSQSQCYDEFGFQIEAENKNSNLPNSCIEDPQHRLKWIAHLEFSQSNEESKLTLDGLDSKLPKTDTLRSLVRTGVPHSLRPHIWMRMSGAYQKRHSSEISYKEIVKLSSSVALTTSKQIEKDLLRTLPGNICFNQMTSIGISKLRRILHALAWLYPEIGYCQGTGMIAASLLLLAEEEDAFWLMATIVEDLLPASYYSSTLIGVQADQKVLMSLISNYLSDLDATLKEHDIELSLITLHWFLTLFASVVHMKILLRVWDLFFCDGSIMLFQITLGMLKLKEPVLIQSENSAQIFNLLSDIPGDIEDIELLLDVSLGLTSTLNNTIIETHRRRHLAYLMADQGALVGNPETPSNLPKQQLNRRQVKKSKSMLQLLLFGEEAIDTDLKSKNIKHTEIMVDLKEAILQVGHHFMSVDPKLNNVILVADYSMESHTLDHENYVNVSRTRRRRAKALLGKLNYFERNDDDELGFRKNDIITIISQKDEHCWIGELNGLRGWFPAKFVELLDERSKQYSMAGDDSVSETVTDLVRGSLCPVIKQVLEHGMKKPSFLEFDLSLHHGISGGPCHPWLFIEEAATKEVERDFNSVYSRLVLCKTYRLDEDGKVLTPEELLYRCVQATNLSHDNAHAQMDVKLRSLICLGLNEQVLHLWLEVLCSCLEVVQKWYHPWSFINSPGWVQIKCELRVLSQFAFNLNPDWELPPTKEQSQPLRDGVRDMLVKHHLFSWDL